MTPPFFRNTILIPLAALSVTTTSLAGQSPEIEAAISRIAFRELGPAVTGGRISDLAVNEANPAIFYVGTASGGVWKTTNQGMSWDPIFDDQPTASIGDVTLAPSNPNIVWVGTGEPQNRQSSPWGAGVFKSTDAGRTWQFKGLADTKHIGRIQIHPTNPDIVYVAAVGHLFGPNEERGVFKTTDGGATWSKVLYKDEHTGAIDLVMDPSDPSTLFAAMYQRRRTAFGFSASGSGSGLYRTHDGGTTWTELTNGLPAGDKGRIGIDVYRRDGNLLYALIETAPGKGRGLYRTLDRGDTWEFVNGTNPRPMYFSMVRIDPSDPERIYIGGVQFGISDDGGKTFREGDGAPSIHVDHHALWIDPGNPNHLILGSDGGVSTTFDRAKTWRMFDNMPIGQFYEIGVDMRAPYYVCGGLQDNSSWCGPSQTLTNYGIRNSDWYDVSGGDGFYNKIDPTDYRIVYSESQGGNVSRVDITTGESIRIRPVARPTEEDEDRSYRFNWNAPIAVSPHDPATVFIGANHLLRSSDRGITWEEASPDLTRAIDRDTLTIMGMLPSDSTLSRNDGISNYGNITTIAESPLDGNVIYVGTDDGNLQVTRDAGKTWSNVIARIPNLPNRTYVSRLEASRHQAGRLYATFDGHLNDDYRAHVYVSDDYGDNWRKIVTGLPEWSVNVIREHHRTPNLLFVGNEIGVYVSIDRGQSWTRLKNNMPTVPVDDIAIHPIDNDLVLGTHGRSIWVMNDITPLEQLGATLFASTAALFPVQDAFQYSLRGGWPFWGDTYQAKNPPLGAVIRYYMGAGAGQMAVATGVETSSGPNPGGQTSIARSQSAETRLTIRDTAGKTVRTLDVSTEPGVHEVVWDFRTDPPFETEATGQGGFFGPPQAPPVLPGTYTVQLDVRGESHTQSVQVLGDPRIQVNREDRVARQEALDNLMILAKSVRDAQEAVRRLTRQINDVTNLLKQYPDLPAELETETDSIKADLETVRSELGDAGGTIRLSRSIEGATVRPTTDQLWQIDQTWQKIPNTIERLNDIILTRMSALNRKLDEHGVRPDAGDIVTVPSRRGNIN